MSATGNAIISAKVGPGITNTTLPIADVKNFTLDFENQTLHLVYSGLKRDQYWDISADTTYTLVLTAGNFVLTVA